MYQDYDIVILKDGRIADIVECCGDEYIATVGNSPRTWETVYLTDDEIERKATQEEIDEDSELSDREMREQGYLH